MLYWLDRCCYQGWLSMDQYPYCEDAANAIGESIHWLRRSERVMKKRQRQMDRLVVGNNAAATSPFLREVVV